MTHCLFILVVDEVYEPDLDMHFKRKRNNHSLPNAREVSNIIHASDLSGDEKEDGRRYSLLVMQLGQFLDHDITLTPQTPSCQSGCGAGEGGADNVCCDQFMEYHANPERFPDYRRRPECWPIPVTEDDPLYDQGGPQCLEFRRSIKVECDVLLRTPQNDDLTEFNEITHFVDLSSIYGSLQGKSLDLRVHEKGLLKFNQFKDDMLPFEVNKCPLENTGITSPPPLRHPLQFEAGDVRANENPGLQSFHTLWVMEHNRLAKEMYSKFPHKTDEEIFQETRKYVMAEWQNVVYNEWLPLVIGEKYMTEYGLFNIDKSIYETNEKPNIMQEFSTAAFRFGHGLVRSIVDLYDVPEKQFSQKLEPIKKEGLPLPNIFFKTDVVQSRKIQNLLTGMTAQGAKEFGPKMSNAVRLQLFKNDDDSFGNDLG